jgi:hypothetical protein
VVEGRRGGETGRRLADVVPSIARHVGEAGARSTARAKS